MDPYSIFHVVYNLHYFCLTIKSKQKEPRDFSWFETSKTVHQYLIWWVKNNTLKMPFETSVLYLDAEMDCLSRKTSLTTM